MSIEAKNISYNVDNKKILKNISATFPSGKISVIIGPNGAGKSTFLRAIANLIDYNGEILIDNRNIKDIPRKEFAQKIGILPQSLEAPKDLNVEELACYGREPYRSFFRGEDENVGRAAVEDALKYANVFHLKERKLRELSGGERQRANLAMVFAGTPKVLLLDEPTTYLDISHQIEVMDIVKNLNQKQKITTIMVLHDLNHAETYADFVAVMKDGEIFKRGEPRQTLTQEVISDVFNVKCEILRAKNGDRVIFPIGKN